MEESSCTSCSSFSQALSRSMRSRQLRMLTRSISLKIPWLFSYTTIAFTFFRLDI